MISNNLVVAVITGILLVTMGGTKVTKKRQAYIDYDAQDPDNKEMAEQEDLQGRADPITSAPGPPGQPPDPVIIVPKPGDPGNCNGVHCTDTESCAFSYSSDIYFICQWWINNPNTTNSTENIAGHCDPITHPPFWGADGSNLKCLFQSPALATPSYHCVCSKGVCPKEDLKICEVDHLHMQAIHLIDKLMTQSEQVNIGDPCNYTLEQQLPQVIKDYEANVNLYRVVSVLGDATDRDRSKLPLCNRKRLMTCVGDKCGCTEGTAQRDLTAPSGKYYSYYCYATSGKCDRDPFDIIPQFQKFESAIHNHYGSPKMPHHRDPKTGCLYNLCRNVKGNKCN